VSPYKRTLYLVSSQSEHWTVWIKTHGHFRLTCTVTIVPHVGFVVQWSGRWKHHNLHVLIWLYVTTWRHTHIHGWSLDWNGPCMPARQVKLTLVQTQFFHFLIFLRKPIGLGIWFSSTWLFTPRMHSIFRCRSIYKYQFCTCVHW